MGGYRSARVVGSSAGAGLRAYMLRVYDYMFLALALTALVSWFLFRVSFTGRPGSGAVQVTYVGSVLLSPAFGIASFFGLMGLLLYMNTNMSRMSVSRAQQLFFAYAAAMGVVLAPVALVYTGGSIARAFLVASASFGAMSLYGYTTRRDLTPLGSFLFMGVVGLLGSILLNAFLSSSALGFAISVVGVLVFSGLTAWDTQEVKASYFAGGVHGPSGEKRAIFGAMRLYVDLLNMFLFFLHFTGERR